VLLPRALVCALGLFGLAVLACGKTLPEAVSAESESGTAESGLAGGERSDSSHGAVEPRHCVMNAAEACFNARDPAESSA
jgi:hypothetical protein